MKKEGVDQSEMRERLHGERRRHRGRLWYDLGEHELTDEEREMLLVALSQTKLFLDHSLQQTVTTVGRGAHECGMSFDESLHYHYLRHVGPSPLHLHDS